MIQHNSDHYLDRAGSSLNCCFRRLVYAFTLTSALLPIRPAEERITKPLFELVWQESSVAVDQLSIGVEVNFLVVVDKH